MASYTAVRAKSATLSASTVDTITLANGIKRVLVINRSTSGWIWAKEGSVAPTVAGDECLPVGPTWAIPVETNGSTTVVKLISSGALDYTVTAYKD